MTSVTNKKKKSVFSVMAVAALAAAVIALLYVYDRGWFRAQAPASAISIDRSKGSRLLVDGRPYLIKGVCYSPIPIGKDYEYNFWGDDSKPWLTDGQLMKDAGINTVRLYRAGKNAGQTRQVLDDLYNRFGIRTMMGSYLGFWSWPPPNYSDAAFCAKMKAQTLEMVRLYKDSPGILMWVLGNENNYSFDRNIQRWSSPQIDALPDKESQRKEKARIYYSFVNDLAREIKKIDPRHPVVMGVGETASLELAKASCPDIDVLGMLAYRGASFGNLFRQIKQQFDLPVVLIEWGADSYNALTQQPDEEVQANFIRQQWQEISRHTNGKGEANCLGGMLFEWTDEWWKGNENLPRTWSVHDTASHWNNPSYYFDAEVTGGLNMNEEWWGIMSLDPAKGDDGKNARVPKKAYSVIQSLWAKDV